MSGVVPLTKDVVALGSRYMVGDGRHRDHPGSSQCGGRDVMLQQHEQEN